MSTLLNYPDRVTQRTDGAYVWYCRIDEDYNRKITLSGLRVCIGMAVFLLAFGAFLSYRFNDRTSFWIVAGCVAAFLLISFFFFGMALRLQKEPKEVYRMIETDVKTGTGKSSAYFSFKKARQVIVTRKYIELRGKIARMRVYAPEADYDFVKSYILNRVPGDADIRYE